MVTDGNVTTVLILTVLSLLLCIVYGLAKWNKEGNLSRERAEEEAAWSREEKKIEEELSGESDS